MREGFKAPDEVWNQETEIIKAFTNKFDFFPNTFKPEEDKNGNGILDPGEDFYSITGDGVIDYTKTNGILDGPDQDRGALEGAIWAIMPLCIILLLVLTVGLRQRQARLGARNGYCLCSCRCACSIWAYHWVLLHLENSWEEMLFQVFASIQPWESEGFVEPIFKSSTVGKCLAILFGFILGYGATLAEPALNALGATVEKITVGAFKKKSTNAGSCNGSCLRDCYWSCKNSV